MRRALALAATLALAACDDPEGARRAAAVHGLTDVQTTGYAWFGCDEKDSLHTGFVARGADGSCVEGVVCSGWMKGATLRIIGESNACPVRAPVDRGAH